jgi:hypothetical protein
MNLHFTGEWSGWFGLMAALVLAYAAWRLYRRETRSLSGRLAWLLPLLRSSAVFLLVMMLTEPVFTYRVFVGQLARVILLVDGSESMSLTDEQMDPARKLVFIQRMGWISPSVVDTHLAKSADALATARQSIAAATSVTGGARADAFKAAQSVARDIRNALSELKRVEPYAGGPVPGQKGAILRELYASVPGVGVADLRRSPNFPDHPSERSFLPGLEEPSNVADNYGTRLRGFVIPPVAGNYTFMISSDEQSELWLSPDADPARKILIARVPTLVNPRQFDKFPEQKSSPIPLAAGQKYAIEILHKEATGPDHLCVAWQMPDGAVQCPIPGAVLSPSVSPSAVSKDQLAALVARFNGELLAPSAQLAQRKNDPKGLAAGLQAFNAVVERWEQELRAAFSDYAARLVAAGDENLRPAIERFDATPRWRRVEMLLLSGKDKLLTRVASRHNAELDVGIEKKIQYLWGKRSGQAPDALPMAPTGQFTDLGDPVEELVGKNEAERIAVVLFTDGQHNEGKSPAQIAKILGNRRIPVFPVGVGGARPPDLAILSAKGPETVSIEDRVRGEIVLKDDMPPGEAITLRIQRDGKPVWETKLVTDRSHLRNIPYDFPIKELAQKDLTAQGKGVQIFSKPFAFQVSVTCLPGEKKKDNNENVLRVRGVLQRQKILLLDGRPRWEFRYLRNLFERDQQWEVNAILAPEAGGLKRGAGPGMFPNSRDLLYSYDLIVLGEMPIPLFKKEELEWMRDFVDKRGGGFIFVDGRRGELPVCQGTPLETLLPIEWVKPPLKSPPQRLELTDQGAVTPPLLLSSASSESVEIWKTLPPPHWIATVRAQRGTETLLEAVAGETKLPAIVLKRFGAGKVLYFALDESWRWRYQVADKHHARFWNQMGKWMMEPPFAVRDQYVAIDVGDVAHRPGETVEIRIRLKDTEGRPVRSGNPRAVLYRGSERAATVSLVPDENESGIFRGKSSALPEGNYEVRVEAGGYREGDLKARAEFMVAPVEKKELTELDCKEDLLRQVAQNSGGQFLREEESDRLPSLLDPMSRGNVEEREIVLWQSGWWFVLVIALFTAEWILRKRGGLL